MARTSPDLVDLFEQLKQDSSAMVANGDLAGGMVGYANGVANHRAAVVTGMLIVLFALTIFVIVDLDRPRRGLIRVSQISMTELKKSLDKPPP